MAPLLCARGLSVSYRERQALADVSFSLDRGEVLGLVGPNGCGKTTLIRCLDRILDPEGDLRLDGRDLSSMSRTEIARTIAYVPQNGGISSSATVFETILMGRRPHLRWSVSEEDKWKVSEALALLDIGGFASRRVDRLSGGERQRVLIARALAQDARLLLLDEPLSALDPVAQEKFIADLKRLHREDGLTIVQVSHSRREAHLLATRMAVIIDGTLMDEGEAEVVLNTPRSREVASFVGIENILDGMVTANDGGHVTVDAGGRAIEAVTDAAVGEEVTLCIRGDDVVVAVEEGRPSSARNTMAGTIVQVVENGPIAEVRVDAGVMLTAVLTRRSVQDLGLAPGIPVTLSVKATAVHVIRSFS